MFTLEDIAILAPSKEPQDLTHLFPKQKIYNPVQVIHKHEEIHFAFCKAIVSIEEPFFTLYDWDDPVPELPSFFENYGILYGDNLIIQNKKLITLKNNKVWSFDRHKKSPFFIHRAICDTALTKQILKEVSSEPIWTEWWLYLHLGKLGGAQYSENIKMYWDKKPTGLHNKSSRVIANTKELIQKVYP